MIAVDLDHQVGDHVTQLRAAFVKTARNRSAKARIAACPRVTADRRAVEPRRPA